MNPRPSDPPGAPFASGARVPRLVVALLGCLPCCLLPGCLPDGAAAPQAPAAPGGRVALRDGGDAPSVAADAAPVVLRAADHDRAVALLARPTRQTARRRFLRASAASLERGDALWLLPAEPGRDGLDALPWTAVLLALPGARASGEELTEPAAMRTMADGLAAEPAFAGAAVGDVASEVSTIDGHPSIHLWTTVREPDAPDFDVHQWWVPGRDHLIGIEATVLADARDSGTARLQAIADSLDGAAEPRAISFGLGVLLAAIAGAISGGALAAWRRRRCTAAGSRAGGHGVTGSDTGR